MKRIATFALLAMLPALAGYADTEVDMTKEAMPDGRVYIETRAGSVEVIGWDKEEIHVEGRLESGVKRLDFEVKGDRAVIEVVIPSMRIRNKASYLTIHVPSGSELDVETVTASIEVEGMGDDDISVESTSGSIAIDDCGGEISAESTSGSLNIANALQGVRAETVSGSVEIAGSPGPVEAETVSGRIRVEGARESVSAECVSGRIEISGTDLEDCSVQTISGSIDFEGSLTEDGELDASTISGSIVLDFSMEILGEIDASSFSGGIQTNLGGTRERVRGGRPGRSTHIETGDGDMKISAESFSGSVTINAE